MDITDDSEDFLGLHVEVDGSDERWVVRENSDPWDFKFYRGDETLSES